MNLVAGTGARVIKRLAARLIREGKIKQKPTNKVTRQVKRSASGKVMNKQKGFRTMRFSVGISLGVAIIILCAVLIMFSIPVGAHHNTSKGCTTIKEDIKHLEIVLTDRGSVGKVWLWSDSGYSIAITASPVFEKGKVILSFYDGRGCLMPHPNTGAVRTTLPVTDKIKAYIAKSKLFWSNTDKILLTSAGYAI